MITAIVAATGAQCSEPCWDFLKRGKPDTIEMYDEDIDEYYEEEDEGDNMYLPDNETVEVRLTKSEMYPRWSEYIAFLERVQEEHLNSNPDSANFFKVASISPTTSEEYTLEPGSKGKIKSVEAISFFFDESDYDTRDTLLAAISLVRYLAMDIHPLYFEAILDVPEEFKDYTLFQRLVVAQNFITCKYLLGDRYWGVQPVIVAEPTFAEHISSNGALRGELYLTCFQTVYTPLSKEQCTAEEYLDELIGTRNRKAAYRHITTRSYKAVPSATTPPNSNITRLINSRKNGPSFYEDVHDNIKPPYRAIGSWDNIQNKEVRIAINNSLVKQFKNKIVQLLFRPNYIIVIDISLNDATTELQKEGGAVVMNGSSINSLHQVFTNIIKST